MCVWGGGGVIYREGRISVVGRGEACVRQKRKIKGLFFFLGRTFYGEFCSRGKGKIAILEERERERKREREREKERERERERENKSGAKDRKAGRNVIAKIYTAG